MIAFSTCSWRAESDRQHWRLEAVRDSPGAVPTRQERPAHPYRKLLRELHATHALVTLEHHTVVVHMVDTFLCFTWNPSPKPALLQPHEAPRPNNENEPSRANGLVA